MSKLGRIHAVVELKKYFLIILNCGVVLACVCFHTLVCVIVEGQRPLVPLEVDLEALVSLWKWVLETELKSIARAEWRCDCWASSLTPSCGILTKSLSAISSFYR